ncbi:mannose-1-phosphate guanylyltransferase/mannose-6-phosphate isomerase [Neokomagataea anthophila]|uniref:mannose-1-phosphate guanylyltransferase n=1 Tax=Neokomagataea anthophila TaxID=2826925 RepID=A0ABS5E3W1_9PROT|nr:mannose-1-phosphate guanylyltransferase/mannose-6-phosphate isomerase [Neokomagataea anthophila]MBR0558588.1 mannose-1-phosphate guanylyltransferase/mannose-6-phosphate isomerase [Neokomagataea anthophila]
MTQKIVPVVLSGGTGSRLWPVSRGSYPKQFWPLIGKKTLIQDTVLRGCAVGGAAPVVVCNAEHRFIVAEQLREVGVEQARIVLEPVGRNSAPAIAAAAFLVAETDPDAVLWVMAADASIQDEAALQERVRDAVTAAEHGYIVTFGMTPTRPETGYGYIEAGEALAEQPDVFAVSRFVEKPNAQQAEELLKSDRFLWNSGMFIARASVFLAEMERLAPDVFHTVQKAVQLRHTDMDFERLDVDAFGAAPDISVDYAIAERTNRAAVVPGQFGWSDIGSWDALWDLSEKDDQGNAALGEVFLDQTQNCYVRSDHKVTTVSGVDDLIVVVTTDAVMITHRDKAQDVKKVVARLSEAGRPEARVHNQMHRPWGFYESLIQADRFQVKRIVVHPGAKLSLQKHYHRAEHWVVVAGTAVVTRDDDEILVRENESVYLPLGCRHRLANPGKIPLTLIEVQSGPYLGEDDIIRFQDDYSRH